MSNISVDYDILNQKQTPAFYASSLATRPAFGFPGRIFIDTDTPSSGIYRDTGSAWVQVADPGAGTTGTLQQVTTNGNTTTLGIVVQGININDGAGTGLGNTAIGSSNLSVNTTGQYNTAIGFNSLISNISGINNTAVGVSALTGNTTGRYNTAIGNGALTSNTNAEYNTAIGFTSLTLNTTGANNTALGNSSLASNTTASFNTAIGGTSLQLNTTGANNTAVGYQSLTANTTGANNSAVGSGALSLNTTGINNTAIGQSSLAANLTGSYNVALGVGALGNNLGSYNVGIGHSSLNAVTTGTNNSAIGYASGSAITTGSNNTIIGGYGGTTTLTSNIVLSDGAGNVRLFSNSAGLIGINQAVGTPSAQLDIHTTATYGLAVNGTGTSNAYLGFANAGTYKWRIGNTYNAGANTFDIYNLGTSSNALSFNSTTNAATFSSSVTAGAAVFTATSLPLKIQSTTNYETSTLGTATGTMGYISANGLYGMYIGIGNSGNTWLQSQRNDAGTSAYNLLLQPSGGNVGIGTISPSGAGIVLNTKGISGNTSSMVITESFDAGSMVALYSGASSADNPALIYLKDLRFGYGDKNTASFTETMRITATNNLLLGTTIDSGEKFQTNGPIYSKGGSAFFKLQSRNLSNFYGFYANDNSQMFLYADPTGAVGTFSSTTGIYTPLSDINKKKDFEQSNIGLNSILGLKPTLYRMKNEDNTTKHLGFIAQEVKEFLPQAYVDNDGFIGLNYQAITATLVKAIQELNEKLERNNIN